MTAENRTRRARSSMLGLCLLLGWMSRAVAAPSGCAFVGATSARIGNGSVVEGDLGANGMGGTVRLGRRAQLADDTRVAGDTVELWNGSNVFDVAANALERSRSVTVRGAISTPDLPLATPFCEAQPVTCEEPAVSVEKNSRMTLEPGSYGQVVVENGGALALAPGAYTFCGIRAGRSAEITIGSGASTTLAVAGDVVLENGSRLIPAAGTPPPRIVVAGRRLDIAAGVQIEAFFVARAARAIVGRGAMIAGAICADTLSTSRNVRLGCVGTAPPTTTTTVTTSSTSTSMPTSSTTSTTRPPSSTTSTLPPISSTTTTTVTSTTTTSLGSSTSSTTTSSTAVPTSTTVAPSTTTTSQQATTTTSTTSTSTTASPTSTTRTTIPPTTTTSTTSTTTSTSTTTITFPLNCGNGNVNTGETCDDGNNSDNDACPSDCRIDACTPVTTSQRFVSVRFAPPEGGLIAGLTLLLDYPEGSVDLPGNATTFPAGTVSGVPTGAFVSVNDLNFNQKGHAARMTVGASAALTPGEIVRLRFQDCAGATIPPASAFPCTVLTASDPFLNAVNGVTCFVVVE